MSVNRDWEIGQRLAAAEEKIKGIDEKLSNLYKEVDNLEASGKKYDERLDNLGIKEEKSILKWGLTCLAALGVGGIAGSTGFSDVKAKLVAWMLR